MVLVPNKRGRWNELLRHTLFSFNWNINAGQGCTWKSSLPLNMRLCKTCQLILAMNYVCAKYKSLIRLVFFSSSTQHRNIKLHLLHCSFDFLVAYFVVVISIYSINSNVKWMTEVILYNHSLIVHSLCLPQ